MKTDESKLPLILLIFKLKKNPHSIKEGVFKNFTLEHAMWQQVIIGSEVKYMMWSLKYMC